MQAGDPVILFDGCGGEFHARLDEISRRRVRVTIHRHEDTERESPLAITLVQALATSDKMDFIVQKAVELGAAAVQPIVTERATLKLSGERAEKRTAHWQAIARAACEQCGRNRVPDIGELLTLAQWLALPTPGIRLMLHPSADQALASALQRCPDGPLSILIGPEGGFSERESALAAANQILPVRLGPRVLRTETAGLAALAALNAAAGDFI
jgi:16S rRNA (uracil1498-N3)-methyltransferase